MVNTSLKLFSWLENVWIAGTFALCIILPIYWLFPNIWKYIFVTLFAYLIADIVRIIFIRGGNGIVQFTFTGNTLARHKGHAYLIFLVYIIASTLLGAIFSNLIVTLILNLNNILSMIFANLFIILLVYGNFYLSYYK